jgi:signal transduction histidine kinase
MLIESEKLAATGRMAATIAHEINNPLESLTNLIFLARQNHVLEGEAHQHLVTAEAEVERISLIARQTLSYYRDTNSPAETYLHDLVQNVLMVYRSRLVRANIEVDTRFNDLQKITVNKEEMLQVFSNVISNSIDAMDHGGRLHISIRNVISFTENGIQMVVRDTGSGIKQEYLERVFDPFFTTKGDFGTGIGLWVAKQLVEKRGGRISVLSSTEQGQSGNTILIFVPFAASQLRAVA